MRAFLNIFPTNNLGVLYNFIHGLAPCWRWNFWLFYDREIASEIIVISFTTEFKHDYISVPRLQIMLYQHIQIYYAVVCLHSKYVFMSSTFFICFLLTFSSSLALTQSGQSQGWTYNDFNNLFTENIGYYSSRLYKHHILKTVLYKNHIFKTVTDFNCISLSNT